MQEKSEVDRRLEMMKKMREEIDSEEKQLKEAATAASSAKQAEVDRRIQKLQEI